MNNSKKNIPPFKNSVFESRLRKLYTQLISSDNRLIKFEKTFCRLKQYVSKIITLFKIYKRKERQYNEILQAFKVD